MSLEHLTGLKYKYTLIEPLLKFEPFDVSNITGLKSDREMLAEYLNNYRLSTKHLKNIETLASGEMYRTLVLHKLLLVNSLYVFNTKDAELISNWTKLILNFKDPPFDYLLSAYARLYFNEFEKMFLDGEHNYGFKPLSFLGVYNYELKDIFSPSLFEHGREKAFDSLSATVFLNILLYKDHNPDVPYSRDTYLVRNDFAKSLDSKYIISRLFTSEGIEVALNSLINTGEQDNLIVIAYSRISMFADYIAEYKCNNNPQDIYLELKLLFHAFNLHIKSIKSIETQYNCAMLLSKASTILDGIYSKSDFNNLNILYDLDNIVDIQKCLRTIASSKSCVEIKTDILDFEL